MNESHEARAAERRKRIITNPARCFCRQPAAPKPGGKRIAQLHLRLPFDDLGAQAAPANQLARLAPDRGPASEPMLVVARQLLFDFGALVVHRGGWQALQTRPHPDLMMNVVESFRVAHRQVTERQAFRGQDGHAVAKPEWLKMGMLMAGLRFRCDRDQERRDRRHRRKEINLTHFQPSNGV